MVNEDIPLNAGCLAPITRACLRAPHFLQSSQLTQALVCSQDSRELSSGSVGHVCRRRRVRPFFRHSPCSSADSFYYRNVVTSQRITDVVLRAFSACAASQGDCNNFTFGTGGKTESGGFEEGWGYYETIAGGAGAGEGWDGESGVHTQYVSRFLLLCNDRANSSSQHDQHAHDGRRDL